MNTAFKNFLAILAGYAAMAVTVFATFTLAYMLMGPDRAFRPDVYDVSAVWIALTFVVSWSAATLGGRVCLLVARNSLAPKILIVVVGVLGAAQFVMTLMMDQPVDAVRLAGEPSAMNAMNTAVQPLWITIVNPIIGILGVAYGSGLLKKSAP